MTEPAFDPTVLERAEELANDAYEGLKQNGSAERARAQATIATAIATIEAARTIDNIGLSIELIHDTLNDVLALFRDDEPSGTVTVPLEHHKPYVGDVRPPTGKHDGLHVIDGTGDETTGVLS